MRLFILGFLCLSSVYAETITAVVGQWPPYHAANDTAADKMTQSVEKVFKKNGMDLSVKFMPWVRAQSHVKDKNADISISWIKNDLRQQEFLFSKAIGKTKTVLFSANNHKLKINDITDLNGLRVGHVRGYSLPKEIEAASKQGYCKIDYAKNDQQNMLKLVKGRVDLIVIDSQVAQHHITRDFMGYQAQLTPIDVFAWEQDLHIIVSKNHFQAEELLTKINAAITKSYS